MLGSGFSCPTTSPVASAVASSDTSTGVATAPMPVSIDDHSLTGTPRYFLPAMSFGDSTFSFDVSCARALEEAADDAHVALVDQLLVDLLQRRRRARVGRAQAVPGVAIDERRVEHRRVGDDLAERREVVVAHRDRARLDAVDELADAAELRVREHLDLDAAVGALLDELGDLVGVERLRRVGDADVRVAQLDLRLRRATPRASATATSAASDSSDARACDCMASPPSVGRAAR